MVFAAISLQQLIFSTLLFHFLIVVVVLRAEPAINPSAHNFGFSPLHASKQNFTYAYAGAGPPPTASTHITGRIGTSIGNSTPVAVSTTTTKPKGYKCTDEDMNCYHW